METSEGKRNVKQWQWEQAGVCSDLRWKWASSSHGCVQEPTQQLADRLCPQALLFCRPATAHPTTPAHLTCGAALRRGRRK